MTPQSIRQALSEIVEGTSVTSISPVLQAGGFAHRSKDIAPDIRLRDIIWGALPFVLLMIVAVPVCCFAPELVKRLPDIVIGGK